MSEASGAITARICPLMEGAALPRILYTRRIPGSYRPTALCGRFRAVTGVTSAMLWFSVSVLCLFMFLHDVGAVCALRWLCEVAVVACRPHYPPLFGPWLPTTLPSTLRAMAAGYITQHSSGYGYKLHYPTLFRPMVVWDLSNFPPVSPVGHTYS